MALLSCPTQTYFDQPLTMLNCPQHCPLPTCPFPPTSCSTAPAPFAHQLLNCPCPLLYRPSSAQLPLPTPLPAHQPLIFLLPICPLAAPPLLLAQPCPCPPYPVLPTSCSCPLVLSRPPASQRPRPPATLCPNLPISCPPAACRSTARTPHVYKMMPTT